MAVTVASLQAVLDLDNKEFNRGLKSADKALDNFESQMPDLIDSINRLTKSMDKFGGESKESLETVESGADNAKGSLGGLENAMMGFAIGPAAVLGAVAAAVVGIATAAIDASRQFDNAMRQIEARTGKTGAELEGLGDVAKEVFTDNWGESLGDAADAVIAVNQVLGLTGDAAKEAAESALIMRDVFGKDIDETVRGTNSLVKAFGITTQEAMDMVAKVIQNVGDPAGDLLDTANEYATIFGNAGFSAQEMFGILEEGSRQGIRNFDQTADAVKEFVISIETGSDDAIEAINNLFRKVGEGDQSFFELEDQIDDANRALDENKRAMEELEPAYEHYQGVVDDTKREIEGLRRELDKLSRPNLKGMEEFEDRAFELEMKILAAEKAANQLELAGKKDSKAFEQTSKDLERLGLELDALRIEEQLVFGPQLRENQKAIDRYIADPMVTVEENINKIHAAGSELLDAQARLGEAEADLKPLEDAYIRLQLENEGLQSLVRDLTTDFENSVSPAEKLLQTYQDGGMSIRDLLEKITGMMGQLDTAAQQDIGQALFGTKFEDNGEAFIRIFSEGIPVLENWAGTVEAAGDAVSDGPWNAFQQALREIQVALIPLGDLFAQLVDDNMPAIQSFVDWLVSAGVPGMIDFSKGTMDAMVPVIGLFADLVKSVVTLAEDFATLLDKTGLFNEDLGAMDVLIGAVKIAMLPMSATIMGVTIAVETLSSAIQTLNSVLDGSINPMEDWLTGMSNIGYMVSDSLTNLLPNSPQSPLAMGIDSVAKSLSNFPQLNNSNLGGLIGSGGGNMGSSVTVNVGGVSAITNTDGNANDEAIRLTLELLRSQLESAS